MRVSIPSLLLLSSAVVQAEMSTAVASEVPSTTTSVPECTATSSTGSGAFFDVRPDMAVSPDDATRRSYVTKDYFSRGYDYKKNFTMNVCGAVVEPVKHVHGLDRTEWPNVAAYYTMGSTVYSIGQLSQNLTSRGRKLVLQYTNGSPCGPGSNSFDEYGRRKRSDESEATIDRMDGEYEADSYSGLDESFSSSSSSSSDEPRRKSTTISFLCDRDPGATTTSISFVGADPEECAYFFEARSIHACAHAEPHKPGSVGPGSIFGLILLIAILVYVLGGIFYNRTVAHSRGWRQIPNYSLWAGVWRFICELVVRSWYTCTNRLPSSRGYSQINSNRNAEAENRLIDQLDEEWDD